MLKRMLKAAVFAGGILLPGAALAVPAMVTADLNVRSGPGTQHQRIATIPNGYRVDVDGCLRGYNWCRVDWAGPSGWVSGNYLAYLEGGYRQPLPQVGVGIGVPIIRFEIDRDRDRYDRRWRHRDRWDRDRRHRDRDWRRDRDRHAGWRDRDRGRDRNRNRGRDREDTPDWLRDWVPPWERD
ncbi:SH3 domain-containing protein [Nitratireductor sp. GCM10026969]|uniref:SH3 domain-containing protein n=1 Tax=Nitratireductor sp. GCM10026969 TaxID=3252645 RepID=UPI0036131C90